MWEGAGIIRNRTGLLDAQKKLDELQKVINSATCAHINECYEVKNMLLVSKLIVNSALARENSIGAHFREDFCTLSADIDMANNVAISFKGKEVNNGEVFTE